MKSIPRQIPHRPIGLTPVHLVYRLAGSIPQSKLRQLRESRERLFKAHEDDLLEYAPGSGLSIIARVHEQVSAAFEPMLEAALHHTGNCPYWLSDVRLQQMIIDSYHFLANKFGLKVFVVCVMSNHVHALVQGPDGQPPLTPATIMQPHKSFTAHTGNKLLGRSGGPFWSANYFDRDVRPGQFTTLMWYILNNPVKAGLVNSWEEWSGTWLNPELDGLYRTSGDNK